MNFAAIMAMLGVAKTAIGLYQSIHSMVIEWRTIARQNAELSPEQSAALDAAIKALQSESTKPAHWRIE